MSQAKPWLVLLAAVVSGCGGKVNVGDDEPMNAVSDAGGAPAIDSQPRALKNLPPDESRYFSEFAVADGHFYLGGLFNIWEVAIEQQHDSWRRIDTMSQSATSLQAFGGKLGMMLKDSSAMSVMLATCSLPSCSTIEPVISFPKYLGQSPAGALFQYDSAFWAIDADRSIYRCALPSCTGGPQAVWTKGATFENLLTLGDNLFWLDGDHLFRSRTQGAAPVEELDPQATLQSKTPTVPSGIDPTIFAIASDEDSLYALMSNPDEPCLVGACPESIVRWRDQGDGEREILLSDALDVRGIAAFDGELVWVGAGHELKTCRAEACAATQRSVGHTGDASGAGDPFMVAADSRNLYWLDAVADAVSPGSLDYVSISAVALLPKPE